MVMFSRVLERYGENVEIIRPDGTGKNVKAFVQPVMDKSGESEMVTKLGDRDFAKCCYFGPPDVDIKGSDVEYIIYKGGKFDVLRCEVYTVNGTPSHREGVLRRREEA